MPARDRWTPFVLLAVLAVTWPSGRAHAQHVAKDFQNLPVGQGTPNIDCVLAGGDGTLESVPLGDDFVVTPGTTRIRSGQNGICETAAAPTDVQAIPVNQGAPGGAVVLAGKPAANDGICDYFTNEPGPQVLPLGDDVLRVVAGKSEPGTVVITPGANQVLNTAPAGTDVAGPTVGVICPGPNLLLQSSLVPDDELPVDSTVCNAVCANSACILPGRDGVLQTVVAGDDVRLPVITSGPEGIADTTRAGDDVQLIPVGEGSKSTVCVDAGPDGIAQTTLCGNGIRDFDEDGLPTTNDCDDGNAVDTDDCFRCRPARCGDGVRKLSGTAPLEECDDGNTANDDGCVGLQCKLAVCGDGFVREGVEDCEPPGTASCDASCKAIDLPTCGDRAVEAPEECDDGNASQRDNCVRCRNARCGDGQLHTKGSEPPAFETCDDGNLIPGDGCSVACLKECGNGTIDGRCSQGTVNAPCATDSDCDSPPATGNGICVSDEECDPGSDNFCVPGPTECSDRCQIPRCGNGLKECDEECDLGAKNGGPKSSCTADCKRSIPEPPRPQECLGSWVLDAGELNRRTFTCQDDDPACDLDAMPGQCTFRVALCFNNSGVHGCTPGDLHSFDLRHLRIDRETEAHAAEAIAGAVRGLSPGGAFLLDRCVRGARGKVCSIPDDVECDAPFGGSNGRCDVGAGVLFDPSVDAADRCTDSVSIVVGAGEGLTLRARTTRTTASQRDTDVVRLVCRR